MYEFIQKFAPHLDRDLVADAISRSSKAEVDELFSSIEMPVY